VNIDQEGHYSAKLFDGIYMLEKIITDVNAKDIERAVLYINKTQFVDGSNNLANQELTVAALSDLNNSSFSVAVPTQNYVFARIGVKISGVEDMIFSPLQKVQF